ncbi:non-ribosomal peptide synthetase [Kitasatospora sp. NPDC053057]|uniref:non-ribosomal peptide synthetase n=1 Tax=Kitasatospora sp. NPDC053057 TaxID=3364062 RepID=UPI0037CA1F98
MSATSELVHELVEQWVERRPDLPAVSDPVTGEELTYRELWTRAGRLAADLVAAGVGPHDLVAIAQERSVELVVSFLGVLRAGAAYLPLDVMAPADRIADILEDAGIDLVVCSASRGSGTADRWHHLPPGPRVIPVPTGGTDDVPEAELTRESPAYVAFTSGSTGRPKGVVVPHRAVRRLAVGSKFCTVDPGDRVASSANPAFDATTFEIWNTLTAGGTVVVFPGITELPIDDWIALVRGERIDSMFLTTSLFHTVARERPAAFGALRNLVVGGEQLELAAVQRVLAADPPGRLVNGYGPTETTTFAAYFDCTTESLAGLGRIPIGYPLQDTTLLVLDEALVAVPPGELGELCVGGPGVATGYLGRPELTAEKFVVHPVSGEVLYRTGDLAHELPGGAIEVSGRRDRQVKLRGFRIELEEIEREAVATGLLDAAFTEKVGEGPTAMLVGFALPAPDAAAVADGLVGELQRLLGARLPSYMLPSRWLVLDRLPIGPTGKTDRAALLSLLESAGAGRPAADDTAPADSAPAGARADGLREVWQEVLGVPEVDPQANFIELGGNSILAMQVSARVLQRFGLRIDAVDVLMADTLAELASRGGKAAQSHAS